MGEIKSTLDLVMARTRHLTLSREEKAAQQLADLAGFGASVGFLEDP